jgi:hypothetical protein
MKPIPFSGMMCLPHDIQKDGDFKIKGTLSRPNTPLLVRYEHFASIQERDKRYNMIVNLLKVEK